jgi:hypothetical protein
MKKLNNKRIKGICPFVFLLIVMLLMHKLIYFSGDDFYFGYMLKQYHYNIVNYLTFRYNNWSSRIIIEICFVIFNYININIWKVVDSLIYTMIAVYISKLFNKSNNTHFNWLIVLLVLIYPFTDMSSAGYVTTTIAYVWPLFALLYLFNNVENIINGHKLKWYHYVLSIPLLFLANGMEQSCLLMIGFLSLYILKLILDKKFDFKNHWYIVVLIVFSIMYLVFILTCPGNKVRSASETLTWYPNYANYHLFSKLYLGIIPTLSIFLQNRVVITIFSLMLCLCTFKCTKNKTFRILSIIVLAYFGCFSLFREQILNIFPYLKYYFDIIFASDTIHSITLKNILPITSISIISLIIGILLYVIFGKNNLKPLFIYLASLCSRMVMGFSPTVFASNNRTAFFMYFGLLIIIFMLYQNMMSGKNKLKDDTILYSIFIILAIFNVLNIINTIAITSW